MVELIDSFVQQITIYLQQFGVPFGIGLIILESILPALPLGVFIAFNMLAFGEIIGFIISWGATCIGCFLSYFFFAKLFSTHFIKKASSRKRLNKIMERIKKIKFSELVLIVALPFTPAFLVNIACGLVNTNYRKFVFSILIGKLSIVYFWGFVGKSFLNSITDMRTMIILVILLIGAYILSKIVNKKMKID